MDAHDSQKLCMEEVRKAIDPADFYTSMAALRAELSAMTLTKLMKQADAAGVSKKALEGAEAEADNKEAVIRLILNKGVGGAEEMDPARDAALRPGDWRWRTALANGVGEAARSLGKEGLRMKSDDAAAGAVRVDARAITPRRILVCCT